MPLIDLTHFEDFNAVILSFLAQLAAGVWLFCQYRLVSGTLRPYLGKALSLDGSGLSLVCLLMGPAIWGSLSILNILVVPNPSLANLLLGLLSIFMLPLCVWKRRLSRQGLRALQFEKSLWVFLPLALLWSLTAALPQWIYDQYNYHLAVPRLALVWGNPATHMVDGHLFVTGLLEFSIVPLWTMVFGEVFASAVAQSYCFFLMLSGTFLFVKTLYARRRPNAALLLCASLILLGNLPDLCLAYIFKPDGPLIIVFLLAFYLVLERRSWTIANLVFFAGLALGLKNVAIHGLLVLAAVSILRCGRGFWRRPEALAIGMGLLFCVPLWVYRILQGGTPFYPADAIVWPDILPEGVAASWHSIAFPEHEVGLKRWSGLPNLLAEMPLLALAIAVAGVAFIFKNRTLLPRDQHAQRRLLDWMTCLIFFLASWPLFYYSGIYPRFLAPLTGLLFLAFLMTAENFWLARRRVFYGLALVLLLNSGTDVKLITLKRSWDQTGFSVMAHQEPTLLPIRWARDHLQHLERIVSSRPEKYFFTGKWLYNVNSWESAAWASELMRAVSENDLSAATDAVIIPKEFLTSKERHAKLLEYFLKELVPYCQKSWEQVEFDRAFLFYDKSNLKK